MTIQKTAAYAIIISSLLTMKAPVVASSKEMRAQGLTCLGLILGLGGTHQLVKRSEKSSYIFSDVASGVGLLAAGFALIALSTEIIQLLAR